jgi:hypothetical protein
MPNFPSKRFATFRHYAQIFKLSCDRNVPLQPFAVGSPNSFCHRLQCADLAVFYYLLGCYCGETRCVSAYLRQKERRIRRREQVGEIKNFNLLFRADFTWINVLIWSLLAFNFSRPCLIPFECNPFLSTHNMNLFEFVHRLIIIIAMIIGANEGNLAFGSTDVLQIVGSYDQFFKMPVDLTALINKNDTDKV